MKGKKVCPKCEKLNGCRSLQCKYCNYEFIVSKKPVKIWEKVDWHKLAKGDIIKVKQGCGPYYVNAVGEQISFGYHGKFRVKWIDENGIHAHGKHGHTYLWMGEEKEGRFGTFLRKHKFLRKIP